jgi:ABC-type phosphate transport system auxiliary subunit
MTILFYIGFVSLVIVLLIGLLSVVSAISINYFPQSKITVWILKHIITTEDLDPPS